MRLIEFSEAHIRFRNAELEQKCTEVTKWNTGYNLLLVFWQRVSEYSV